VSVFPPYRGGISNFSDYLFTHLTKIRDVDAINFKRLYPNLLFPGATQFQEDLKPEYASRLLHSYNPLSWRVTGKTIARQKPEVLLFSFWHPFFIPAFKGIIAQVRKYSPKTKICTVAHNVSPHEGFPFATRLMQSFFQKNDLIITLSNQTQKEFEHLSVTTQSLTLFHPVYQRPLSPIPKDELKAKYGIKKTEKIPLFFGLIRDYKGLDVMIHALNTLDLQAHQIRPFIVGEFYTDKDKLLQFIKPEHKEQYVIIDRFVTREEANEIFTISDALILPYKSASQSGVFNDALNFHLPAIVSDQPGLTEHITHQKTGLIFESENIAQLRHLLENFLTKPKMRTEISCNLIELKAKLSWEIFTQQLAKAL
jgi:glycosyltransferase involved in cell wall biosynthesis